VPRLLAPSARPLLVLNVRLLLNVKLPPGPNANPPLGQLLLPLNVSRWLGLFREIWDIQRRLKLEQPQLFLNDKVQLAPKLGLKHRKFYKVALVPQQLVRGVKQLPPFVNNAVKQNKLVQQPLI
jgi:hypothetical protein